MKRLLVAVLALALTVAIASPALGGPSIESIGKTADKALQTGKSARSARSASRKAAGAQTAADIHASTRREVQRLTRQLEARPAASCRSGYTSANLSWGHKCLHAGEFCKRDKNAEYHRYGYHCKANGRLRRQ